MSFTNDALITTASGQQKIFTIMKGDHVLAGSVKARANSEVHFSSVEVAFSQAVSVGPPPVMVYVRYGNNQDLICTRDQPLLLINNALTTAGKLLPGQQLLGAGNIPVSVKAAYIGNYLGGVHHIAVASPWLRSLDKHLLLVNGLIVGDFTIQVHFNQLRAAQKVARYNALPEIG
jgi:hypothetical protein